MNHYFIGLMLSAGASNESGIAIIDRNNEIILMDKLFTMQDIQHFFDNYPSLKNSQICVSLPSDNTMLNGKWRVLSKQYQLVGSNSNFINVDNWTQRFSTRGCEYFNSLIEKGANIKRFDLFLTRQELGLNSHFKDRSPADCKALQSGLKIKYGFNALLSNMMPMALLEALVGAVLAKKISDQENREKIFQFNGIPVLR